MAEERASETVLQFGWEHFDYEGRYVNLRDALDQVKARRVCLAPLEAPYGDMPTAVEAIRERMERTRQVAAKLTREGVTVDLVLPSLTDRNPALASSRTLVRQVYAGVGRLRLGRLWVDDRAGSWHRGFDGAKLCQWLKQVGQQVRKQRPRLELGLVGARPGEYVRLGVTGIGCAQALAGRGAPLLAVGQGFGSDERRTGVLEAAEAIATAAAQARGEGQGRCWGVLDFARAGTFAKSAEATQMQVNVNLLHGVGGFLNGAADPMGMALRERDRHLEMIRHCRPFWRQLERRVGSEPRQLGIAAVVPGGKVRGGSRGGRQGSGEYGGNGWVRLLWRLGLPVTCVTAGQVEEYAGPFALTGAAVDGLSRRELSHIFERGVALDAGAAGRIEEAGQGQLMGMRRQGPLAGVLEEVLSDQAFGLKYYGHRTRLAEYGGACWRLEGLHEGVRPVTTLRQRGRLPNTPGASVFDDNERNSRCFVLPYDLAGPETAELLCTARQEHLHDVFGWLARGRLVCRVQGAADVVPFLMPARGRKKLLLALLNVGFDWAIGTRVQLGPVGFEPQRVRVIEEHGELAEYAGLGLVRQRDYTYVQLTEDAAVAPMQMTVLLLEG